jgi:proline dehydrogenase
LFHRLEHFKYHLIGQLKKTLDANSVRLGDNATDDKLVRELLDDAEWTSQKYDEFKRLLSEAESFGIEEPVRPR